MKSKQKSFYVDVAEKLIKQLKQGTAPWQKPWNAANPNNFLPVNPTTDKRYRGINTLALMNQEHSDPRWMTYKQAIAAGAQVRKGEKSTAIQYWKVTEQKNKLDENGVPVKDADGKPVKVTIHLERPRMFMAAVFNAEQIDGLPPHKVEKPSWNSSERAEQILNASTVTIQHTEGNRAFYRSSADTIHLPNKAQFSSSDKYYATALHELGHATGHPSRLNRDMAHPFGSEGYAKEELCAEIASMILGDELKIGHNPEQHAAYVKSWIKILKEDPKEIFRAAADAEKIQEFVLALEQQQEIKQEEVVNMDSSQQPLESSVPDVASITTINNKLYHKLIDDMGLNEAAVHTLELLAEARRSLLRGNILNDEFSEVAQEKLGFELPDNWSGQVRIEEKSMQDASVVESADGAKLQSWGVYAQLHDNTAQWLADFDSQQSANQLAGKLQLLDATGEPNTYESSVKLTKIQEARVRAKPDSTEALILAAEAVRKEAENIASLVNAEKNRPKKYLAVPYSEKEQAKSAGARWDSAAKSWYVGEHADMTQLERFMPENNPAQQSPALSPVTEFAGALRSLGCVVNNDHAITMDGQTHRIKVEGDKPSAKSGFYVGHQDGRPAGYIKNNRSGETLKWKAKGYSFTNEQKAELQAEAVINQQERKAKQDEQHKKISRAMKELLNIAPLASSEHPYLINKQVRPDNLRIVPENTEELPQDSIIKIGKDWNDSKELRVKHPDSIVLTAGDLLIPVQDVNKQVWSVQSIQDNGSKFFAAGGSKESNFAVTGDLGCGIEALEDGSAIVIAEGYATADTLSQALGYATVAAFDAGNLKNVAIQLREKFPDKVIIIAGDDDLKSESKQNVGREKALEAADAVNGTALFPIFAPGEQIEKRLSDFNDLANKSILGKEGVKRQVTPMIELLSRSNQVKQMQVQPDRLKQEKRLITKMLPEKRSAVSRLG